MPHGESQLEAQRRVLEMVVQGRPLADVLHAQAADVREAGRRNLIETAARKEVFMMVPVVFLVLPVTVFFAFWPGVVGLSPCASAGIRRPACLPHDAPGVPPRGRVEASGGDASRGEPRPWGDVLLDL